MLSEAFDGVEADGDRIALVVLAAIRDRRERPNKSFLSAFWALQLGGLSLASDA